MHSRFLDDRASVTAEFAAALPAVVLTLACALGAITLASDQLRLQGAAFDAARLLGRGDPGALQQVLAVASNASLTARRSGVSICVDTSATVALGVLSGIVLHASACSLADAHS